MFIFLHAGIKLRKTPRKSYCFQLGKSEKNFDRIYHDCESDCNSPIQFYVKTTRYLVRQFQTVGLESDWMKWRKCKN